MSTSAERWAEERHHLHRRILELEAEKDTMDAALDREGRRIASAKQDASRYRTIILLCDRLLRSMLNGDAAVELQYRAGRMTHLEAYARIRSMADDAGL